MRAHGANAILLPVPSRSQKQRDMPPTHEIRVRGHLGETMLQAFPGLQARASGDCTLLRGTLPDQAALYGVLAQLEALGLELVELRQLRSSSRRLSLRAVPFEDMDPAAQLVPGHR